MTIDYELLKPIYPEFEKEIAVLKSLVEQQLCNNRNYHPMVVFINGSDSKMIAITTPNLGKFDDMAYQISEIMQLYPALDAKSAIITLLSKVNTSDSITYDSLNIFALSSDNAYILTLPFTHTENNTFVWQENHFNLTNVVDMETEHEGADFISMLFVFTHMPSPVFSVAEILSYLSHKGYIIQDFGAKFNYFQMSSP